jgi:hypothetical protein
VTPAAGEDDVEDEEDDDEEGGTIQEGAIVILALLSGLAVYGEVETMLHGVLCGREEGKTKAFPRSM